MLGSSAAADDVAQEAFVRLWRSDVAPDADARTTLAWLYRTSTRLAIDVLRERRRGHDPEVDAATVVLPCGGAEDVTAARSAIVALVDRVPEDELEAVLLARVDGLSQPEVAAILGISERTVRRRIEQFDARTADLKKELAT